MFMKFVTFIQKMLFDLEQSCLYVYLIHKFCLPILLNFNI